MHQICFKDFLTVQRFLSDIEMYIKVYLVVPVFITYISGIKIFHGPIHTSATLTEGYSRGSPSRLSKIFSLSTFVFFSKVLKIP